ncbi:hypothetical protein BROUX41_002287 [Berkeleyomyces rouxiae]|uniref:uncharacterized protein n=1 Tax=Berkeleyomyces rouxiae TaxID=2035830 RepID=UPI003B78D546
MVAPITGMLRRRLILDLGIAFGGGFALANAWWYGFHIPRREARDTFYAKLEAERESSA